MEDCFLKNSRPPEKNREHYSDNDIFVRVRKVLCEYFSINESEVNLDIDLSNYLDDQFDVMEIFLSLEEEFDIEIPDGSEDELYSIEFRHELSQARISNQSKSSNFSSFIDAIAQISSMNSDFDGFKFNGKVNDFTAQRCVSLIHKNLKSA